jgi:hypothetical protein
MRDSIKEFEQYLNRRYPKSSTAEHYVNDLRRISAAAAKTAIRSAFESPPSLTGMPGGTSYLRRPTSGHRARPLPAGRRKQPTTSSRTASSIRAT